MEWCLLMAHLVQMVDQAKTGARVVREAPAKMAVVEVMVDPV